MNTCGKEQSLPHRGFAVINWILILTHVVRINIQFFIIVLFIILNYQITNYDLLYIAGLISILLKELAVLLLFLIEPKKKTLWNGILKHIEVGTTIITDKCKSYKVIEEQEHKISTHLSLNGSENFGDLLTGAHGQHVERSWKEVKRIYKRYEGILQVESHLAEFIWRNNEVQEQEPF